MKYFPLLFLIILLGACTGSSSTEASTPSTEENCEGVIDIPKHLRNILTPVDDPELLARALGKPTEGKLCQGKTYKLKAGEKATFFRAWNNTNPASEYGSWWALSSPSGQRADYRSDYEICYQWSPLNRLTECEFSKEVHIVLGTGQSAQCSEYLTYPVSSTLQVYIENADTFVSNCKQSESHFLWKKIDSSEQ